MIVAGTLNLGFFRRCTFEAVECQMQDGDGNPINITGFDVSAEVRTIPGSTVIIDLNPSITDAANGIVTIPAIADDSTHNYAVGAYMWDMLLGDGSDDRQRILAGRFDISDPITDSS